MTIDDMKRHPGVHPRPRSSLWQWRIKAPVDLASLYPSQWAHRVSLGTADLREANAKAAALQAEWLARFEAERRQLNPQPLASINAELAQRLAEAVHRRVLERDEDQRSNPHRWPRFGKPTVAIQLRGMTEDTTESVKDYNTELFDRYRHAVAAGKIGAAMPALTQAAGAMGLVVDERTPGLVEALRLCLSALRDAYEQATKRDEGHIVNTPQAVAAPRATIPEKAANSKRLRDVFDRWKESGDKPRTSDSIAAYDRALRQFEAQYPQVQLRDIDRDMGDSFRTLLRTASKTSKTAADKFTAIKSLLKYAYETLRWSDEHPWRGLSIQYTTTNKRRPWTQHELETLFAAPLHQAYELPNEKHAGADAAYWVPLLALYSGARAGELCQLQPGDVRSIDGIPALVITDEGEGQKVKTAAGHRTIPIHSELIRLGFLEYAEAQQKRGAASLWPALPQRAEKASDFFGRWFLKHRVAVGLPGAGGASMHHFRHTVRPLMRRAGFDGATQDKITGHETKGSIGDLVYDHWLLEELRPAVEAIKYPYLKLPKVYGAATELTLSPAGD